MKYNEELLKYQKVLTGKFKKTYKSFISVEVDPLGFEEAMENKNSVNMMSIEFTWSVRIAIKENESLSGISTIAKNIFTNMFGESYVVPWINLTTK